MSKSQSCLGTLSVLQSRQIDGLNYCAIRMIQLDKVTKRGNEITITFKTTLDKNKLNLKKAKLCFRFF